MAADVTSSEVRGRRRCGSYRPAKATADAPSFCGGHRQQLSHAQPPPRATFRDPPPLGWGEDSAMPMHGISGTSSAGGTSGGGTRSARAFARCCCQQSRALCTAHQSHLSCRHGAAEAVTSILVSQEQTEVHGKTHRFCRALPACSILRLPILSFFLPIFMRSFFCPWCCLCTCHFHALFFYFPLIFLSSILCQSFFSRFLAPFPCATQPQGQFFSLVPCVTFLPFFSFFLSFNSHTRSS